MFNPTGRYTVEILPSDILHTRHNANRGRFQPKWRLLSPQSRGLLRQAGVAELTAEIRRLWVKMGSDGVKELIGKGVQVSYG